MNCQQSLPLLSAYLDGEVSPAERNALEAHVRACAPCREKMARMRAADALFAAHRAVTPAPFFEARLMARIAAGDTAARSLRDFISIEKKLVVALGALLCIITAAAVTRHFSGTAGGYEELQTYVMGTAAASETLASKNTESDDIASCLISETF